MKSTVEILREARELIATPEQWNREGFGTRSCPCLAGAVYGAANGWRGAANGRENDRPDLTDTPEAVRALRAVVGTLPPCPFDASRKMYEAVGEFNDAPETTHADVLAAFDRAIAAVSS